MSISKKSTALAIASLLLLGAGVPSVSAAVKAGSKCSKAGVTTGSGSNKLTCTKGKRGLSWVKTPESTVGTARNPVPLGSKAKIGSLEYTISRINPNADAEICAGNAYNTGCTFDSNFNTIVDPNSKISWTAVEFQISNLGNDIAKPGGFDKQFYLVLANGQLLESELFVTWPANLYEVQVIPGGSGKGSVAFAIPKSGNAPSNLLVLRDRSSFTATKDVYFSIK